MCNFENLTTKPGPHCERRQAKAKNANGKPKAKAESLTSIFGAPSAAFRVKSGVDSGVNSGVNFRVVVRVAVGRRQCFR